jgi:hypothetical protein
MSEPSHLKLNIGTGGGKTPPIKMNIPVSKVFEWIKDKGYDEHTTFKLNKILSKFPSGTYEVFMRNIETYVLQIQKERSLEQD